jgi:predicted nucleotidyltransferase
VLRTLNARQVGLSGREIARISNISNRTAQIALANLESLGVVNRAIGGRDHLFTFNRKNKIAAELVEFIYKFENDFVNDVITIIKKKLSIDGVTLILFGSVSRKEEEIASDLDLCIVYSDNKSNIEKLIHDLRGKLFEEYNISLAPFYISKTDFKKSAIKNLSPVNNIVKEGLVISGQPIKEIIK